MTTGEALMPCNDSTVQWEEEILPLLPWQALTQCKAMGSVYY